MRLLISGSWVRAPRWATFSSFILHYTHLWKQKPSVRFELTTPGLQDQCSNHWATTARHFGHSYWCKTQLTSKYTGFLVTSFPLDTTNLQQSGAEEACWAHNPEVGGSKPPSATYKFWPHDFYDFGSGFLGALWHATNRGLPWLWWASSSFDCWQGTIDRCRPLNTCYKN